MAPCRFNICLSDATACHITRDYSPYTVFAAPVSVNTPRLQTLSIPSSFPVFCRARKDRRLRDRPTHLHRNGHISPIDLYSVVFVFVFGPRDHIKRRNGSTTHSNPSRNRHLYRSILSSNPSSYPDGHPPSLCPLGTPQTRDRFKPPRCRCRYVRTRLQARSEGR